MLWLRWVFCTSGFAISAPFYFCSLRLGVLCNGIAGAGEIKTALPCGISKCAVLPVNIQIFIFILFILFIYYPDFYFRFLFQAGSCFQKVLSVLSWFCPFCGCPKLGWVRPWATWASERWPCPWQGGWHWMGFKVSPISLRFCDSLVIIDFFFPLKKENEIEIKATPYLKYLK